MSVLIIPLLCEHSKCTSWLMNLGNVLFFLCWFFLSEGCSSQWGWDPGGAGSLRYPFVLGTEQGGGCLGNGARGLFKSLTIFKP